MKPLATLLLLLAAPMPVLAGRIDVTGEPSAWVHPGATLEIQFGIWNYGLNNPGYSPYPTQIGLEVIGLDPGSPLAAIGGTTLQYFQGFLFEGWLESVDGDISIPFRNPNAELLGLPEGALLVTPGTYTAGGRPLDIAIIAAYVALPESTSEALFGANAGSYNSGARIRLRNLGEGFAIGIGPGYTVQSAVREPGVAGSGPVRTSGVSGQITIANPEPSTWLMLTGALAVLALRARRSTRSRS